MGRISLFVGLFASVLVYAPAAEARVFEFDIPELQGYYDPFSGADSVTVPLDLGITFTEIRSVSLRLTGTQVVGQIISNPLTMQGSPLPLAVQGWYGASDPDFEMAFTDNMPAASGPFDVPFALVDHHLPIVAPDYRELLDGRIEFFFSVWLPPIIPEAYIPLTPTMTLQSATLLVDGSVPEPSTLVLLFTAAAVLGRLALQRL